ncbi:MAG: ABC transporter permease [Prosthecobacter sp.]
MSRPARRTAEWLVTLPSLAWLGVFFIVPAVLIIVTAFRPADLHGGVGAGWSTEALHALRDPAYLPIVWRTVWLSAASTAVCLALALPMAFQMARVGRGMRQFLLLLVVIPFLSNFLIRVFAWKSLLHPEGALTKLLVGLRVVPEDALLLNNAGAVLLVLIYTQLPFAILPLYAAAEKFDFGLMDAARDLGAGPWRAFSHVFIPGVRRGLISAAVMVFVSSLGQYVIPQLVGGASDEMLGSKIAQRVFADRNLPHASALAAGLMLAVLVPMLIVAAWQRFGKKEEEASAA